MSRFGVFFLAGARPPLHTQSPRQHLLGNETARDELGRRGRELVSSRHTYASRVPKILAAMEEVLRSNSGASPAKATGRVAAGTAVETPPGGAGAAADATASDGSAAVSTTAAGVHSNLGVALSMPECSRVKCASAVVANGTTAATTETAVSASRRACRRPAEAVPADDAGEERSTADGMSDQISPMRPSGTGLTTAAEHRRECPEEDFATGANGGSLDGGTAKGDGPDAPSSPSSGAARRFSARGLARPNAPMVLVVYRSDFSPPEVWRRTVEAAAVTVAGGARVTFMEIGERGADGGTADDVTGQGLAGEERQRRKALEARLSRLVAAERTGEQRIPLQPGARVW